VRSAVSAALAGASPNRIAVTVNGTPYDVETVRRGGTVRQAVLDTWYLHEDLEHLVRALIIVGLVGIGAATVVGVLLGRRSIAPLGDALARQRRFVADASHELRAPLTRLYTRAQLLLRPGQREGLPARLADELDALVQSAGEVNDVVEDLLISAGMRTDPSRGTQVDLAGLVVDVVEAERPRLGSRTVVHDLDVAQNVVISGAESPLRRMITTLLENAVGHTGPDGRISLTVRRRERAIVELEVADDGTGFDPADRERIFERFAQSGAPGLHRFGLGLALAREIVTDHGGTIRAFGRPGEGATFTVRLPAAPTRGDDRNSSARRRGIRRRA
jgi:signal transduction histidine kinase